jgi:hypothetical protein
VVLQLPSCKHVLASSQVGVQYPLSPNVVDEGHGWQSSVPKGPNKPGGERPHCLMSVPGRMKKQRPASLQNGQSLAPSLLLKQSKQDITPLGE